MAVGADRLAPASSTGWSPVGGLASVSAATGNASRKPGLGGVSATMMNPKITAPWRTSEQTRARPGWP
jgi:hypothetical protein